MDLEYYIEEIINNLEEDLNELSKRLPILGSKYDYYLIEKNIEERDIKIKKKVYLKILLLKYFKYKEKTKDKCKMDLEDYIEEKIIHLKEDLVALYDDLTILVEEHNYILIEKNIKDANETIYIMLYLKDLLDDYKLKKGGKENG